MIHRRYGLTNAYGEFEGQRNRPTEGLKPIPSNYVPLHQRRKEAEQASRALQEERSRTKKNWGEKIEKLEKETGLVEVGPDIRNVDADLAADLEILGSDS
jgi:hypothetical protein